MSNPLWRNKKLRYFCVACIVCIAGTAVAALVAVILYGFGVTQSETAIVLLCLAVAVAAVAAILTMFMSRAVIQPVKGLSEASERIARGDFDLNLKYDGAITEFRDTYRSFNIMARELRSIETLRSDFIANVSHEFKTPITAIEGYAMLLQDPELPEQERQDCAERILRNSGRLTSLVSSILMLSKLENQTCVPERAPYRLDEQIRQVMVEMAPLWGEKNLQLELELCESRYNGPENMLYHVWSNLISNAIKFSPEGAELIVTLEEAEGSYLFSVTDRGPGMSEEVQKHIFDKFYQGDPSRKQSGSGLGLPLARRIAQLCGIELSVESAPGAGSTFRALLPPEDVADIMHIKEGKEKE